MSPSTFSPWRRGLGRAVLLGLAVLSATPWVRAVAGTGNGVVIGSDILDANGKVYDYVLLTGPAVTVAADPGQVARVIFVDPDDDLVFVDYSGAGTMSIALDQPTGPAALAKYNLSGGYWKGRAGITIQGFDATSNITVSAVGSLTSSVSSSIFRSDVTYDGVADIGSLQIVAIGASQFGGLRAGNARFSRTAGATGVIASNVTFLGPVIVGDIDAATTAVPSLILGAASDVRILGGDLAQSNGANVRVSGFTELKFGATTNAHGVNLPAKPNLGVLQNVAIPGQPVFTSATVGSVFVDALLSFTVKASAVSVPTYSIAAGNLPTWATLNAATGLISGTPPHTAGSPFVFTVRATNGGASVTQTITISVLASDTARNFVLAITGDPAPDGNGTVAVPQFFALSEGAAAFAATTNGSSGGAADDWILVNATRNGFGTVFREGANAPNNGRFVGTLEKIAVNPSGRVAFQGYLSNTAQGTNDDEAIYSGIKSSITQIARENQPEPMGGPGVFNSFGTPSINASDQVVFWGAIRNTGTPLIGTHGIFVGDGGTLTQIARTYATAPGGGTFTSLDSTPRISASGEVAFYGSATSGNGIFRGNGTSTVAIARVGQAPPEGNGTLGDINWPYLNSDNMVAFYTTLNGTSGGTLDGLAIYRGSGGPLTKIVRSGDAAPGSGQFESLNNTLSVNGQGEVAFTATRRNFTGHPELVVPGLYESVYWGDGTQIKAIARTGDPTPEGGSVFTGFTLAAINDTRTVAFQAALSFGANYRGIYLGDGTETILVARVGDQVLGSTIVSVGFDPTAYNAFKEIAYQVILADGRWGVLLFSPKLKWRQNGDGAWDDGSNWTVSLRPAGYAIAEIDPASGGLVTGPEVETTLRSLKIGGTTTGTAELNLKPTGPITVVEGATVAANGKVSGVGVIKGKVANAGTVSPGNSPGLLKIEGDFTQSATGQSIFQIGGTDPALSDQLWVTGAVDLGGTVKIELIDGFVPTAPVTVAVIRAQSVHLNNPTFQAPAGYVCTTAIKNVDDDQMLQVTLTPPGPVPLTATQSVATKVLTVLTPGFGFVPITASGGTPPYTYAVSPALPAGLMFDANTGAISGSAAAVSSATYTITVTDASTATATNTFTLTVHPAMTTTLTIANKSLIAGTAVVPFSPVSVAGGTSPYVFTVAPALPAGLVINPGSGEISGTPTAVSAVTTYAVTVADNVEATSSKAFTLAVDAAPPEPVVTTQPVNQAVAVGGSATFSVAASGTPAPTFKWQLNGVDLPGATGVTLTIDNVQPANAGIYRAVVTNTAGSALSVPAILGVSTTSKVIGAGVEVGPNVSEANGNIYDDVLLTGLAATVTADPGQITRISYVDLTDDIVKVEFSGAGSVTIVLDSATGPAPPVNYNQPTVFYMKGHARIVVAGADETTNISVYSVGVLTSVDQSIFKAGVVYDGVAGLACIAISSSNGQFGAVRTSNANYFATGGLTGLYAPGVQFTGPVFIGDINASDSAKPVLVIGSSPDTRIIGGDLSQTNGQPVQVAGLTQLRFTSGITSQGIALPARTNQAVLQQNGTDVTAQIVVNPAGPPTATQAIGNKTLTAGAATSAFAPVTASGGTAPYAFSIAPALPGGLTINVNTGAISGTPATALAATTFTVTVTDVAAATASNAFTLTVNAALTTAQSIANTSLTAGTAAAAFTPITAAGGTLPNVFAVAPALPAGLALSPSTGAITGTPTAASSVTTYTVTVTDSVGATSSKTFSLTVNGVAPTISTPPQSQAVSSGESFTLSVGTSGTPPLTYQWHKDGTAITGATSATYTVDSAANSGTGSAGFGTTGDAGDYTVVVSNSAGNATSAPVATITILPAGFNATHSLLGSGYIAGGTITITNTINYSGALSALDWQVLLPAGWSFESDSGMGSTSTHPNPGDTSFIEYSWDTPPASGATFTYTLSVPAGTMGPQGITALMLPRQSGNQYTLLVKPDPLMVGQVTFHSADTGDGVNVGTPDGKIELTELLRMIELFNTRNGSVRTGAYAIATVGTEDGFAPDPARANAATMTLARYHSADTGDGVTPGSHPDGKIELTELLRVIELYNHRTGTVRDGLYHVDPTNTEDGFAPGAGGVALSAVAGTTPDVLTGGAGDDTLKANQGRDILTGGSGVNTFVIALPGANLNTYSTITDAKVGDKLRLMDKGNETFTAFKSVLPNTAVFQDYANAVIALGGDASTNGAVGWFQFNGDTYVVESMHNGATAPWFMDNVDLVVKMSGLVDLSSSTLLQNSSGAPEIVIR